MRVGFDRLTDFSGRTRDGSPASLTEDPPIL